MTEDHPSGLVPSPRGTLERGGTTPAHVAVVGGGPKAFAALERLVHRVNGEGIPEHPPIVVHVFEQGRFGAGAVWQPDRVDQLRLNHSADQVDVWPPDCRAVPIGQQRSLVSWLARRHSVETFPPRHLVGDYLAEAGQLLLDHAPPSVRVEVHTRRVMHIRRRRSPGWRLTCVDGTSIDADMVLLATGHAASWTGGLESQGGSAAAVSAYPMKRWEAQVAALPPGSNVFVRGFGLTAIDVCLRLAAVAPSVTIRPFSRRGLPMLAKPFPGREPLPASSSAVAAAERTLEFIQPGSNPAVTVIATLIDLIEAEAPGLGGEASTILTGPQTYTHPAAVMSTSVDIAFERQPPDAHAYLGDAWRRLYPGISRAMADRGPQGAHGPLIDEVQRRLERIAFGPTPITAADFVDLIQSRRVLLDTVTCPLLRDTDGWHLGQTTSSLVIDAVLPPPGVPAGSDGPIGGLIEDGHARLIQGGRGLDVTTAGLCRTRNGSLDPTLAAIGRPTEDAIVGNDTLSRTLQPTAELWADHVLATVRVAADTS